MAEAEYVVEPSETERAVWLVTKGTAGYSSHPSRDEAIKAAWKMCLGEAPSRLIVRDHKGKVTMERHFEESPFGLG